MLRNGCRFVQLRHLQQALSKSSRKCRLCCGNNVDDKQFVHTSGDKFRYSSKGQARSRGIVAKNRKTKTGPEELFKPVIPEPLKDDGTQDVGEEIAGKLTKTDKATVLKSLIQDPTVQMLAAQHDLEGKFFDTAMSSFRRFCLSSAYLPVDVHVAFKNIVQNVGHVTDLFPFFLKHARTVYPHLNCMEDLKKISDLTDPSQWYPLARSFQRKVIFHAGPTNSGKTYHALKRYMEADSGVYCGPLRLLAMEVFDKCNTGDVSCDLITGETRMYANSDETPAEHVACTVEMMNVNQEYDVAVIDEIQMISDIQRGWSWTRALLGVAAKEIHVCGEETAIDLVRELLETTGDELEVKRYERLTSLTYLDKAVGTFDNVRAGDCIVCFSKRDIFKIYDILISLGHKCAVIYGDLPPGTKIMQSRKFNDPNDPCNIMVATDAVGMGLNLAIKRVVFYSLTKITLREDNKLVLALLSTSQAQQIGGRAGRFRTQYENGEVTTLWAKDLPILKQIVKKEKTELTKAGMNPTAEMIEMFSYHLPKASLSNLLDIFVHVCKMDDLYFMCNLMQFKELAELIQHVPLPLRMRYTLCSSPLKVRKGFAQVMFVKIARQLCLAMPLTYEWLCTALGAPFRIPKSLAQLEQLEGAFDVVDIYLWLSYRYPDMFVDADEVRELRVKLDSVIQSFINRSRLVSKKRKLEVILDEAEEQQVEDVDTILVESNPLQAYKPKPKAKDKEKDIVFAELANELYGLENTVNRTEASVQSGGQVCEVKSFWKDDSSVDIASDIKDSDSYLVDSGVGFEDDGDKILDEEKIQLYSKLTGSYDVKTMFQAEEVKNSMSDERKLQILAAEIAKRRHNLGDEGVEDDIPAATAKLGMKPDDVDHIKSLLTQMKIRKQYPKKKKSFKDSESGSKFDTDNIVTFHTPKRSTSRKPKSPPEIDVVSSDENFKFADRFTQLSSLTKKLQLNSNGNTESSLQSGPNDQTYENQGKQSLGGNSRDNQKHADKSLELESEQDLNNGNGVNNNQSDGHTIDQDYSANVHSSDVHEQNNDRENLTERLLKQGILTESDLQKMRSEWENERKQKNMNSEANSDIDTKS